MRLTIGFYTEGLPFTGETIYQQALGGSETALTYMASELGKRGHEVHVFCKCPKPGKYGTAEYHDTSEIPQARILYDFDVWIVSRFAQAVLAPVTASMRVLWNHDILMPETKDAVFSCCFWADMLFHLSQYHRNQWLTTLPQLEPASVLTTNGVDLEYIDAATCRTKKKNNVFIYTSRPERGMDVLLKAIWPRVLEKMPDAELRLCGYDVQGMAIPDQMKAMYEALAKLATSTPNVTVLGQLNKKQLYRQMAEAKMLLYPTAFPEISCLSAMECAAAGTPILTTDDFALKETVGDKRCLIPGNNQTREYQDAYVARLFEILADDALYQDIVTTGRKHVADHYQWKQVAAQWEQLFIDFFRERAIEGSDAVVKELVRRGDLVAAKAAVERLVPSQDTSFAVGSALGRAGLPSSEDPIFEPNPAWAENDTRCRAVRDCIGDYLAKNEGPCKTRVLDIGSNNGAVSVMLGKAFPGLLVHGLDENPDAVALATKYAQSQECDGLPIGFAQGTIDTADNYGTPYDILFAGELLEHIEDIQPFLVKCKAAVKTGGLLIFTFPNNSKQVLWDGDPVSDTDKTRIPAHPAHFHHFDYGDIIRVFGKQREFTMMRTPTQQAPGGEDYGNTIVAFRNSAQPFGEIDYDRKAYCTPPYQSVSACLITKDAENDIARCLKQLYRICDEIRVHDTGSTDTTLDIVRRFTDKITQGEFHDFGSARNESIKDAHGDWILWIDADEVLLFPNNMRKYLKSRLFNGFVIQQNHLMIDVQGTADKPVRLLRNGKGYAFRGLVHEHCEDVNKAPFDEAISPSLLLPDVHIAHTGYLCEGIRREKCLRNYPLVCQDAIANPERQLTKILIERDFLNFTGWDIEKYGGLTPRAIQWCRDAIKMHHQHFLDPAHKYHAISDGVYQAALAHLGRSGVPAVEGGKPPFEVEFGLGAGYGGLSEGRINNARRWFYDSKEFMDHYARKGLELTGRL